MRIDVSDKQNEPSDLFANRTIAAFQFLLGHPIPWVVHRASTGAYNRITLKSIDEAAVHAEFPPPIARPFVAEAGRITVKHHRRLFENYLRHTLRSKQRDHHLWGFLKTAAEVRSGSYVDAFALVLCVSLESVLKREFPREGELAGENAEAIRDLREFIKQWKGPTDVQARVGGLIANLSHVRAKDRLRSLARSNAIDPDHIRAWEKVRNVNAHEFLSGNLKIEEFSKLLDECTVLFYHVVFAAIRYRGLFTDYATPGWPMRLYPDELRGNTPR